MEVGGGCHLIVSLDSAICSIFRFRLLLILCLSVSAGRVGLR